MFVVVLVDVDYCIGCVWVGYGEVGYFYVVLVCMCVVQQLCDWQWCGVVLGWCSYFWYVVEGFVEEFVFVLWVGDFYFLWQVYDYQSDDVGVGDYCVVWQGYYCVDVVEIQLGLQVFVFVEGEEVFEDFFVGDDVGDDCYQYEYCVEFDQVVCLVYWDVVQVEVQVVEEVVVMGFVCF